VKDQEILTSTQLCKAVLRTKEVIELENATGRQHDDNWQYNTSNFQQVNLQPRGKIWLRVAPVMDTEEKAPLVSTSGFC